MSLLAALAAHTDAAPPASGLPATLRPDLTPYATFVATPTTWATVADDVQAAIAAAAALPVRDRLIVINAEPGTYLNTYPGPGGVIYIRGTSGNPADVIFAADTDSGGVWHWWGGSYTWAEGITLHSRSNPSSGGSGTGPKYPLHITGGTSCLTLIRCVLQDDNTGGDGVTGWDGGSDSAITFYECRFGSSKGDPIFNLHGPDAPLGRVANFINCTVSSGAPLHLDYSSWDSDLSEVHIVGGQLTLGTLGGGATGHTTWTIPKGGLSARHRFTLGIPA